MNPSESSKHVSGADVKSIPILKRLRYMATVVGGMRAEATVVLASPPPHIQPRPLQQLCGRILSTRLVAFQHGCSQLLVGVEVESGTMLHGVVLECGSVLRSMTPRAQVPFHYHQAISQLPHLRLKLSCRTFFTGSPEVISAVILHLYPPTLQF